MWSVTLPRIINSLISSQISQNIRCCTRGTPKRNYRSKKTRTFSSVYLSFHKWRKVSGKFFFREITTNMGIFVWFFDDL